jgi:hypothetical protein
MSSMTQKELLTRNLIDSTKKSKATHKIKINSIWFFNPEMRKKNLNS